MFAFLAKLWANVLQILFGWHSQDPVEEVPVYVSAIVASQNTILHSEISRNVWIDTIHYPDIGLLTSATILARVGDHPNSWYKYEDLLRYDGAEEELRRFLRPW